MVDKLTLLELWSDTLKDCSKRLDYVCWGIINAIDDSPRSKELIPLLNAVDNSISLFDNLIKLCNTLEKQERGQL